MGERLSPYTFAALYGNSKVCAVPSPHGILDVI